MLPLMMSSLPGWGGGWRSWWHGRRRPWAGFPKQCPRGESVPPGRSLVRADGPRLRLLPLPHLPLSLSHQAMRVRRPLLLSPRHLQHGGRLGVGGTALLTKEKDRPRLWRTRTRWSFTALGQPSWDCVGLFMFFLLLEGWVTLLKHLVFSWKLGQWMDGTQLLWLASRWDLGRWLSGVNEVCGLPVVVAPAVTEKMVMWCVTCVSVVMVGNTGAVDGEREALLSIIIGEILRTFHYRLYTHLILQSLNGKALICLFSLSVDLLICLLSFLQRPIYHFLSLDV